MLTARHAVEAEFPAALPSFFSGLKVAASVSVIGAVFGEWAGADAGLGRLVLLANNQLQTPRVYAGRPPAHRDGDPAVSPGRPDRAHRNPVEPNRGEQMRAAAAAVIAGLALVAGGCGETRGGDRPGQAARADPAAGLLPQRRPRADLCGSRRRPLRRGRPRPEDPPAVRSGGSDQAGLARAGPTWRSPTSPRC